MRNFQTKDFPVGKFESFPLSPSSSTRGQACLSVHWLQAVLSATGSSTPVRVLNQKGSTHSFLEHSY